MKRNLVSLLLVAAIFMVLSACGTTSLTRAQENTNLFLMKKYNWFFDVVPEQRAGWSWHLTYEPGRVALPEEGTNISHNWVCYQKGDPNYFTVVLWRLPSVSPEVIEEMIYSNMTDEVGGYREVESTSDSITYHGIVKDCVVFQRDGNVKYVSFYHFFSRVKPYLIKVDGETKTNCVLAFTVYVANMSSSKYSTPFVKEKLRNLVKSIGFEEEWNGISRAPAIYLAFTTRQ